MCMCLWVRELPACLVGISPLCAHTLRTDGQCYRHGHMYPTLGCWGTLQDERDYATLCADRRVCMLLPYQSILRLPIPYGLCSIATRAARAAKHEDEYKHMCSRLDSPAG
ncbi:hypothetical protein F4802DRAFT_273688 [Xylaria palmicola]|nr:hypothetical protein F4802DRAFT_273688 [Xylaria palmicola]